MRDRAAMARPMIERLSGCAVALVLVGGCTKSKECDVAALEVIAATPLVERGSMERAAFEDAEIEAVAATSRAILAACPGVPAWLAYDMKVSYEPSDPREGVFVPDGFDAEAHARDARPMRERVCPGYPEIWSEIARMPAEERGPHLLRSCKLERHGLYTKLPPEDGERIPSHTIADHVVLLYLQDAGVDDALARKVALRLGRTLLPAIPPNLF